MCRSRHGAGAALAESFCAKAAIPEIRSTGGGSIVNVASVRSVVVGGKTPQYDETKAAVAGLTRALAVNDAGERIRVNAVRLGPIFTRAARHDRGRNSRSSWRRSGATRY